VAESVWVFVLLWGGAPPLGAGAGWLLKVLVGWIARLPWAPFEGPLKLIASLPEPQVTIGALAIGALAGAALALIATLERLTVTVSDDRVTMVRGDGRRREVERAAVTSVFVDGKRLVLLGAVGEEVAGESSDLDVGRLAAAFRAHGYPWSAEGDPYRDDYRRWVEGLPGLPAGADALLRARQRALTKGDDGEAVDLRAELARLGVVIRDEKKRQYWRLTGQTTPAAEPAPSVE
jgi:hypothetical protein